MINQRKLQKWWRVVVEGRGYLLGHAPFLGRRGSLQIGSWICWRFSRECSLSFCKAIAAAHLSCISSSSLLGKCSFFSRLPLWADEGTLRSLLVSASPFFPSELKGGSSEL
nr:hypothetical protein Itr_chr01CG11000 [Ipomoea trifida]